MCAWMALIFLFVMLLASLPTWPYSRQWGYGPGGAFLVLLLLFFVLWWFSWLPWWGAYPRWWGD